MKKEEKYNSDITKDDKAVLTDKAENIRRDNGDDVVLRNRENDADFSGSDLDVPGRNIKRDHRNIKDEENQLYGIGSDDNQNLEIDTIENKDTK